MTETAVALLLAHVLADFVFQSDAMVRRKGEPLVQLGHAAIVLALSLALLGRIDALPVVLLAVLHLATDTIKQKTGSGLRAFLVDQAAHLAVLLAIAAAAPDLWAGGLWDTHLPPGIAGALPPAMLLLAGFVVAVRAGGFAVALLLAPYVPYWRRHSILNGGLREGGAVIGVLERALTYLLVLAGQPAGVAFLIAAKSILRFNASKDDRRIAEYVIIGTLASIGWALATAFGVAALLPLL